MTIEARTHPGRKLRLALRILSAAAGLAAADLLALHLARVAGDEAGVAQLLAQRVVVLQQGAGETQADRAGLAGDATAVHGHADVETAAELQRLERLAHDHAARLAPEELIERPVVDRDAAAAGAKVDAGGRGLAAAGAVVLLLRCHRCDFLRSRAAAAVAPGGGARRRRI